jgi:hypothetical protein
VAIRWGKQCGTQYSEASFHISQFIDNLSTYFFYDIKHGADMCQIEIQWCNRSNRVKHFRFIIVLPFKCGWWYTHTNTNNSINYLHLLFNFSCNLIVCSMITDKFMQYYGKFSKLKMKKMILLY